VSYSTARCRSRIHISEGLCPSLSLLMTFIHLVQTFAVASQYQAEPSLMFNLFIEQVRCWRRF
jgi:hypothetical protein